MRRLLLLKPSTRPSDGNRIPVLLHSRCLNLLFRCQKSLFVADLREVMLHFFTQKPWHPTLETRFFSSRSAFRPA